MKDWKYGVYLALAKRAVLPVLIGACVVWLISNGLGDWADTLCSAANNLGISVKECSDVR